MITIDVLRTSSEFERIANEWNRLLNKVENNNPFLTHEWLNSWWDSYRHGKELNIILFKNYGRIIGGMPLILSNEKIAGFPSKAIKFMADHWGNMDFILTESKAECIEVFINWFLTNKPADVAIFSRIPLDSENNPILKELFKNKKLNFIHEELKNVVIFLNKNWGDYLKCTTKKFRYELRHKQKKINSLGYITFERFTDPGSIHYLLPELNEIGNNSWKASSKKGIAVTSEGQLFYNRIISMPSWQNRMEVSLLKLNNKPIAFAVRINYNGTYYALETAYDKNFYDYSPGLVIHGILLEDLFNGGTIKRYELGELDEYKRRWSDDYKLESKFMLFNDSIYGKILYIIRKKFRNSG